MKRKTLNNEEKRTLLHCLTKHNPKLVEKLGELNLGLLDPETINEMRDAVGIELVGKGFKPDDEPNQYGLELENLIDRLGNLYLWPELGNRKI